MGEREKWRPQEFGSIGLGEALTGLAWCLVPVALCVLCLIHGQVCNYIQSWLEILQSQRCCKPLLCN